MKKLRILVVALLALGYLAPLALAIDFKTHEQYGAQQLYSARTSISSSHTVVGIGIGYSVRVAGGTAQFVVKHSTNNTDTANFDFATISSTVYLTDGDSFNNRFEGIVNNPLILISTLAQPGATVYVNIDYLAPRGVNGGL